MDLEAVRCSRCGSTFIPPRYACRACGGREFEPAVLPGVGSLYSYTVCRVPVERFKEEGAYAIGVVRLDDGHLVAGRLEEGPSADYRLGTTCVFSRKDDRGIWFQTAQA